MIAPSAARSPTDMRTYVPDSSTFTASARSGARSPIVLRMPLGDHTPLSIHAALRAHYGRALLLESGKSGRYSYVGLPVGEPFVASGRSVTMPDGSRLETDPFDALRTLLAAESIVGNEQLGGFAGGYIGYLAYDMARHIERIPERTLADPDIPDCQFLLVETFCEIDHEDRTLGLVAVPRVGDDPLDTWRAATDRLAELDAILAGEDSRSEVTAEPSRAVADYPSPVQNLSAEDFHRIVARAREYIRAGDIFQVNLSVRFAVPFAADPLELYRTLRAINPAPYMSLLELSGLAIVSASPELLIRVRDGVVETRPIAGTRPRGATEEEDERNARKLSENEKERAEHLMLVDLERNDLGRVCRFGSVRVEEFMGIERYSHVIHIVSHIRGELAEGRDTIDAIRACFPGGTITGAPKVRSMEIIEELEPHRRGVYTGSIGWLGFDGNAELNIAIRTIVIAGGTAYAQAGAGIVYDSVPEHEYFESVRKARAALEALERTHAS